MSKRICTILLAVAVPSTALATPQYMISPIGSQSETTSTYPLSINNSYTIIGGVGGDTPADPAPFYLSAGAPLPFAAPPSNTGFTAQALNDSGTVVGFLNATVENPLPPFYAAALYQNGQ